jgi:hypothetical protein
MMRRGLEERLLVSGKDIMPTRILRTMWVVRMKVVRRRKKTRAVMVITTW